MTSSRLLIVGCLILLVASFAAAQTSLSITTTSPLPSGLVGAPYGQVLIATGGLTPYSWSVASGSPPPGLILSPSGALFGTPSTAGSFGFIARVTDAQASSLTRTFTLTIDQTGDTQGPDGEVGVSYRATLVPLAGTPPHTWDITGGQLPPGLTLNGTTGVISGTPTKEGTFGFIGRWTDSLSATFSIAFSIRIYPGLAITTASPLPSGIPGVAYSQQIGVAGGKPPYSASMTGPLPAGLTFDPAALVIRGTPTALGTFTFTVTVTDSLSLDSPATASKQFTLIVGSALLAISTGSPLPPGTVGVPYSQTLVATGGTLPYTWRVVALTLPSGLILNPSTGVISGTPLEAGTGLVQISVGDRTGQSTAKIFDWTVAPASLSITTSSPLPPATVGAAYSQAFAATGGTSSYTWSVSSGVPSGLTLSQAGLLSGTPGVAGTYTFAVTVNGSVSKQFTLTVNPATLSITTTSPLPGASAGSAYTQTFAVAGGISPYAWSLASGALPPGLALSTGGVLSGTPTQAGAYNFTVGVADSSKASVTKAFALTVSVPQAPAISVTGLADKVNPAQQPSFDVQLGSAYPLAITGTITLTFTPDAVAPSNDPAIQFSSGGRTLTFTVPAGQTRAFPSSPPALQTGTVAGRIDLALRFSSGGQDITPTPAPVRSVQIPRSAPSINSVRVVRTSGGFNVLVTGYSTPRQVTQAVFTFTPSSGSNLGTTQLTVPVDAAFTTWFTGTASGQFGSTFLYTQPFQVQGDVAAITSVSVTLSSSAGSSQPVSASF